jgi:hypothetical protein
LQAFASDYLLPKTLTLIETGLDHDFFDRFSPALPELVAPLLRLLSEHELPDARITAGYQTHLRTPLLEPSVVTDVLGTLLHDHEPAVARLAHQYTTTIAEAHDRTDPALAAAARHLLASN